MRLPDWYLDFVVPTTSLMRSSAFTGCEYQSALNTRLHCWRTVHLMGQHHDTSLTAWSALPTSRAVVGCVHQPLKLCSFLLFACLLSGVAHFRSPPRRNGISFRLTSLLPRPCLFSVVVWRRFCFVSPTPTLSFSIMLSFFQLTHSGPWSYCYRPL